MRHRLNLSCLLLASIAFAAGGCVVAVPEPPAVAVAAPAPFVWIGPGYYGACTTTPIPGLGITRLISITGGSSREVGRSLFTRRRSKSWAPPPFFRLIQVHTYLPLVKPRLRGG
jgi:hypothetical protein